jgi:uncharacterized protein (DUF983 family)
MMTKIEPVTTPASVPVAILKGLCPACRAGKVSKGVFGMEKECPICGYRINQESGYFLGAMMVGFLAASALTIPPVILLKVMGADDWVIIAYPFLQYAILGPLLIHYAKIIWVHAGYRAGEKMNREDR